ncbi:EVE domain-containing protein [Runella limosa]|uniref:EVE domain-containing protein n=1 Tax=Runella limosa TaxID=370978 RepID=UPI000414F1E0|nr:EVE domain-containing protein [Runella limosa]MCA0230316.1 EVE domain-containing protein [Bacteroidota bacterium]
MNYWLVKSEPFVYSWNDFVTAGKSVWDGVRNYQARNNLQAMKEGDWVLFYHSNEGMEVVGIAQVLKEAYPDPTIDDPRWVVVELVPVQPLVQPVTLKQIKADNRLDQIALIRQSRLSVMPIRPEEFDVILSLSQNEST